MISCFASIFFLYSIKQKMFKRNAIKAYSFSPNNQFWCGWWWFPGDSQVSMSHTSLTSPHIPPSRSSRTWSSAAWCRTAGSAGQWWKLIIILLRQVLDHGSGSGAADMLGSVWEFPRSRLRLQTVLGEGNFGKVWKAEADEICGYDGTILVAVKTVKVGAIILRLLRAVIIAC